jgi:hypothetical protein
MLGPQLCTLIYLLWKTNVFLFCGLKMFKIKSQGLDSTHEDEKYKGGMQRSINT